MLPSKVQNNLKRLIQACYPELLLHQSTRSNHLFEVQLKTEKPKTLRLLPVRGSAGLSPPSLNMSRAAAFRSSASKPNMSYGFRLRLQRIGPTETGRWTAGGGGGFGGVLLLCWLGKPRGLGGYGYGSKPKSVREQWLHPMKNPTTKIGSLKWVVNSPNPTKMGSHWC